MSSLRFTVFNTPHLGTGIRNFLFLLLISCSNYAFSQLLDLQTSINQMNASADPSELSQAESLRHLSMDLVPSAYFEGGVLTLPETDGAQVLFLHAVELNSLPTNLAGLNQLQLIRVIISNDNDLAALSNLSQINTTANLLLICELDLNESALSEALGATDNRAIYYTISVPR
jgi:hypothetical protein